MPSICKICKTKQAKYGYEQQKRLYCKKCKTEKSINFDDICVEEKCFHSAIYNYSNLKPKYCYLHKNKNMKNLRNKMCLYKNCNTTASFGYNSLEYCFQHKKENMINVKSIQRKVSEYKRKNFNIIENISIKKIKCV